MVTNQEFRMLALSFPGTEENPHFERQAFKVINKRIYATIHEALQSANLKLSIRDQSMYCDFGDAVYPVPNKWGQQGWTTFELANVPIELMADAVETAYNEVLRPKK